MTLARAGANVVINYNTSVDEAHRTAADAEALGVQALPVAADVTDDSQVQAMVEAATERFGTIDVLVNNASTFAFGAFPTDDLTVWHRSIDTLVHGPFYCANRVAPGNAVQRRWCDRQHRRSERFRALAGLRGPRGRQGSDHLPDPPTGPGAGPHHQGQRGGPRPGPCGPADYDDATYQRVADETLVGRWGTPEEMGQAVQFLIGADYITGEVITVDGGQRYGHRKHGARLIRPRVPEPEHGRRRGVHIVPLMPSADVIAVGGGGGTARVRLLPGG